MFDPEESDSDDNCTDVTGKNPQHFVLGHDWSLWIVKHNTYIYVLLKKVLLIQVKSNKVIWRVKAADFSSLV